MRILLLPILFSALICHAQPGPPDIYFVVVQDTSVVVPLDAVPYCYVQSEKNEDQPPSKLYGEYLFHDLENTWRKFELGSFYPEASYLHIVHEDDTMRLRLHDEPSMMWQRQIGRGGRRSPELIRFRRGTYNLLVQVQDSVNDLRRTELASRIRQDIVARNPENYSLEGEHQPEFKRIILDQDVLQQGDTLRAMITGSVLLEGEEPVLGITSNTGVRGAYPMPCDAYHLKGAPSAMWQDHLLVLPLEDRPMGYYRLFVCGIGQIGFDIR